MEPSYAIETSGAPTPLLRAAFPGFDLTSVEGGRLRMVGTVQDEAALHGVLHRLQDLGLQILDVHLIEKRPEGPSG